MSWVDSKPLKKHAVRLWRGAVLKIGERPPTNLLVKAREAGGEKRCTAFKL